MSILCSFLWPSRRFPQCHLMSVGRILITEEIVFSPRTIYPSECAHLVTPHDTEKWKTRSICMALYWTIRFHFQHDIRGYWRCTAKIVSALGNVFLLPHDQDSLLYLSLSRSPALCVSFFIFFCLILLYPFSVFSHSQFPPIIQSPISQQACAYFLWDTWGQQSHLLEMLLRAGLNTHSEESANCPLLNTWARTERRETPSTQHAESKFSYCGIFLMILSFFMVPFRLLQTYLIPFFLFDSVWFIFWDATDI